MKRLTSGVLALALVMALSINVFGQQVIVMDLDAGAVNETPANEEAVPEQSDSEPQELPPIEEIPEQDATQEEITYEIEITSGSYEELLQTYLSQISDEYVRARFLEEVSFIDDGEGLSEYELREVYDRVISISVDEFYETEEVDFNKNSEKTIKGIIRRTPLELERIKMDAVLSANSKLEQVKAGQLNLSEAEIEMLEYDLKETKENTFISPLEAAVQSIPDSAPDFADSASCKPMIASGNMHNVYLDSKGEVWTWGEYWGNIYLSPNAMDVYTVPIKTGISSAVKISAYDDHSLALKSDGTVWSWGRYYGTSVGSPVPVQVPGLDSITDIAAGLNKNISLKSDGTVWQWTVGQLSAVQVAGLPSVKAIGTGNYCFFAVSNTGELWTWGANLSGQMGIGNSSGGETPRRVRGINGVGYLSNVAAVDSSSTTLVLFENGTVASIGYNAYGQLGIGIASDTEQIYPVMVLDPEGTGYLNNIVSIDTARYSCSAITSEGKVYTWGSNASGLLGDGTTESRSLPVESNISDAAQISIGMKHSLVLKSDGNLWSVGDNTQYQLGCEYITGEIYSWILTLSPSHDFKMISAGYKYSLVLGDDGSVWGAGDNTYGQIGSTNDPSIPVKINGLNNIVQIAAGYHHSIALKDDGTVWSWGLNSYGQLGDGTPMSGTAYRNEPQQIPGLTGIVSVYSGYHHSFAIKEDGTVYGWGYNTKGQLGAGVTGNTNVPLIVKENSTTPMTGIVAASPGNSHSIFLRNDGTVWCAGLNDTGQLGDSTNTNSSFPVQVRFNGSETLLNIKSVYAGMYHSYALTNDGKVYSWGYGIYGQLGNNGTSNSNTPVEVQLPGGTEIMTIASGYYHGLAITAECKVLAWGRNNGNQLGDKTGTDRKTPVWVQKYENTDHFENVQSITGGYAFTMAKVGTDTLMVWGKDDTGMFGRGNINYYSGSPLPAYVRGPVTGDAHGDNWANALEIEDDCTVSARLDSVFYDEDYFKFTATRSGIYTITLYSDINLKGAFINHLGYQIKDVSLPGNDPYNIYEVCIKETLVAGRTYGVRVYSLQDKGNYVLKITPPSAINADKSIECSEGEIIMVCVSVKNLNNVADKIFTMTFDPTILPINDIVAATYKIDSYSNIPAEGLDIPGSNIRLLEMDLGMIKFKYTKNYESSNFSGIINMFKFEAKGTGRTLISIGMGES